LHGDAAFARFFGGRSGDSVVRSRQLLVGQMCALSGGPCEYIGRDMKTSDSGLGITGVEWETNMNASDAALAKNAYETSSEPTPRIVPALPRRHRRGRLTGNRLNVAGLKCLSGSRFHHQLKTFHDGWRDEQLADGTVLVTTPTGHTYTTKPGSSLFFAGWAIPTPHPHHRPPATAP
jgi:hypothetical protein